ncbi:MAG: DUF4440 domain-containing protein [Oceanobacter sp.]
MEDLSLVRERWTQAWLNGDIATLKQIETPVFSVVSESGIVKASDRYDAIERALADGSWYQGATLLAGELSWLYFGEGCNVIGEQTLLVNGRVSHKVAMTELWVNDGQNWRLHGLHYSTRERDGSLPSPLF